MPFKCPLCFQKLDATQQLARVCLAHPEQRRHFTFQPDLKDFYCGSKSCDNPQTIQNGVFLRHVGCVAKNPYWRGAGIPLEVPEQDTLDRGGGKVFHIQHWVLGILRELARLEPTASEMWFPLQMFRAVNWYPLDEGQGQKVGATIRLAGAKQAGKTVLATMALASSGYVDPQAQAHALTVENWVYVSPEDAGQQQPQEQFLQALLPFSMLREQRNIPEWVAPTQPTRANIKAAFLRARVTNRKLAEEAFRYFLNKHESWRSLLFYDTAGEENEKPAERYRDPVDIGAVLLDGSQLGFFQQLAPANAKTALERLATIAAHRKCLIVTKLDLVDKTVLSPADRELLTQVRDGGDVESGAELQLLQRWLSGPDALPAESDLGRQLTGMQVFFIWTEGLTDTAPGKLPRTYGLRRFAAWALDGRVPPKKKKGK